MVSGQPPRKYAAVLTVRFNFLLFPYLSKSCGSVPKAKKKN